MEERANENRLFLLGQADGSLLAEHAGGGLGDGPNDKVSQRESLKPSRADE
jgi:hypothetical protein